MRYLKKPGEKVVLLGNEAIARGAVEAGIGVASAYPGTPSSEVPMTLSKMVEEYNFYFEYSSNEKVAFETAAGAAWSGVRSIVAMKHFGLNVAADSVSPVAYTGVKGGMVVVVADDPQGWSSAQSEQDTRYYARMFRIPMIEPSNPQEALEFTKKAFELSEEFEIPFILRSTTKVSHSIGSVRLGETKEPKTRGEFKKDPDKFNNIRPHLQELHRRIDKKLEKIKEKYGLVLNKYFEGKGKIGVITSGVSHEYAVEALQKLVKSPPIAKIGLSYPLSEKFIKKFIEDKEKVLVLEELQPVIEQEVERIAKDVNPDLTVHGKDLLPKEGEYNIKTIMPALEEVFNKKFFIDFEEHDKKTKGIDEGFPPRKPVFCPGCPHRSTFYALKQVYGKDAIYAGDIGCYVLGIFEPYEMQDFIISMGASLGLAHGIKKVSDQDIVVTVGDSTFFHAAMPGLANYGFNDGNAPLIVVFDNSVTAMTGHQPHPGTGITGMGKKTKPLKIEEVAKSLGAEVEVVNSFNQKQLKEKIKKMKNKDGLRVLVSKGKCRLVTKRKMRKESTPIQKFEINQDKCKKCGVCTDEFACPAIKEVREKKGEEPSYKINPEICLGCSVCMQICPHDAIQPKEVEE